MLFSSWVFIAAFLPVTWAVYAFLQPRLGREMALLWVTAASLFFYGWFRAVYVLIILISLTLNFMIGTRLALRREKSLLALGVAGNIAALAYFKYAGLFFETLNMFGGHFDVPKILLPLGISFFTFQQITYLVDAWRGDAKELTFRYYTLFVIFFPHMIAGPIVHHKEIIPQFIKKPEKNHQNELITMGLTVFIIGLFKKVAIADVMGEIADPVFTAAGLGHITFFEAWLGVLAYTLQIYFDFSGYSDMAVGLAALFGVRMPVNFLSPYKAADIIDFWRRWHITLSRLLREYLYIPLGGNRCGVVRQYFNLMITMLLGGLWHGANWTFVVWGGLHGTYLTLNHLWRTFSPVRLPRIAAMLLTFIAVMIAWVFFRAENFSVALNVLQGMSGKYGVAVGDTDGLTAHVLASLGFHMQEVTGRLLRINEREYVLWIALALAFLAPSAHELMRKKLALDIAGNVAPVSGFSLQWKPSTLWAVGLSVMAALSLLLLTKVTAFIYFQF